METYKAGNHYKESGKVDITKSVLYGFISLIVSGVIGLLYGVSSRLNPIIYLNFLLLAGSLLVYIISLNIFVQLTNARNKTLNLLMVVVCTLFLLYNNWVGVISFDLGGEHHYWDGFTFFLTFSELYDYATHQAMSFGRFGSNGVQLSDGFVAALYFLEAIILVGVPLYVFKSEKFYFCEDCKESYTRTEMFFDAVPEYQNVQKGNLLELKDRKKYSYDEIDNLPEGTLIHEITLSTCPQCVAPIVDVFEGKIELNKEKKGSFKRGNEILGSLYIDKESADFLSSKRLI